jgi:hypothetical protein
MNPRSAPITPAVSAAAVSAAAVSAAAVSRQCAVGVTRLPQRHIGAKWAAVDAA